MTITVTSRTATQEPKTYDATATLTAGGKTFKAKYCGDTGETRREVKEVALSALKIVAKRNGFDI